jgi:hypothetical protein
MKNILFTSTLIVLLQLSSLSESFAQDALKPRPSPTSIVTLKKDDTYIKVTYGRPHKKDRDTFGGELVPYGQVWRTGANEATEITITKDIKLAGQVVKAGTYTIFTIPEKDHWTIILNSDLGQWGAYRYDEKKDVLRFRVNTEVSEVLFEPFTILFEQKEDKAQMIMVWDKTRVVIPISFN